MRLGGSITISVLAALCRLAASRNRYSFELARNPDQALVNFANIGSLVTYITYYGTPFWMHVSYAVVIAVGWAVAFNGIRKHIPIHVRRDFSVLIPFVLFCGVISIFYVFFFRGSVFINRYFHPLRIVSVVLIATTAPYMFDYLRSKLSARVLRVAMLGVLSLVVAFNGLRYVRYYKASNGSDFYAAGLWAAQHSEGSVGMVSSGTAGYFANNIVNLDGKVNVRSLQALQRGNLGEYIASSELEYIADAKTTSPKGKAVNQYFPLCLDTVLGDARRAGTTFVLFDSCRSPDGITPEMLFYKRANPASDELAGNIETQSAKSRMPSKNLVLSIKLKINQSQCG